jgi:hypothetical protein
MVFVLEIVWQSANDLGGSWLGFGKVARMADERTAGL